MLLKCPLKLKAFQLGIFQWHIYVASKSLPIISKLHKYAS